MRLAQPYLLDGVQVHSAKGDVSGQTAMEEEDTGMVSCCRQPSEEEGRPERERSPGDAGFPTVQAAAYNSPISSSSFFIDSI